MREGQLRLILINQQVHQLELKGGLNEFGWRYFDALCRWGNNSSWIEEKRFMQSIPKILLDTVSIMQSINQSQISLSDQRYCHNIINGSWENIENIENSMFSSSIEAFELWSSNIINKLAPSLQDLHETIGE